jgi:hypothetical protein
MTTKTGSALDHTIGTEGVVVIGLVSGSIRLRAIDGDAVHIRDAAGGDLARTFSIDLGPGSAALRTDRAFGVPGLRGGGVADLEIELPRQACVVVDGTSTEIDADGLSGDQQYKTVSGDITLRAVTGRIRVDGVSGDVDVTAGGRTAMTVRTVSGDLDLRAATLSVLDVTSMSGDIKVAGRLTGDGPFRVETVSGDALLAPAGDVRIEMTTVSGDLHSEISGTSQGGRGRRSLIVGDRGPTVTFRSMSGDLRVVRAIRVTADESAGAEPASVPDPEPGIVPAGPVEPAPAVERADTERVPVVFATAPASLDDAAATDVTTPHEDDGRIAILRALERGEIDIAEAGHRLEALDE